jgi:hypothetical protein
MYFLSKILPTKTLKVIFNIATITLSHISVVSLGALMSHEELNLLAPEFYI